MKVQDEMKQQEFLALVQKYNRGECTREEQAVIFKYCEILDQRGNPPEWDLNEEEETKTRMLTAINRQIDRLERDPISAPRRRGLPYRMLWRVAALPGDKS